LQAIAVDMVIIPRTTKFQQGKSLRHSGYNVNKLHVNIEVVMADNFYSDRFFYVYSCDLNVNVQIKM